MLIEARRSWRSAMAVFADRRAMTLLLLGFSAGMPFLLIFSTLTAWLRDFGVSKTAIGYFTWIGTLYAIKFLWAPVVDRVPLPVLGRLGKRRAWMLAAQVTVMGGLLLMSSLDPVNQLGWIAGCALIVAFGAATQDIAIDAFRIEVAPEDQQAALASTYVLGYRVALIVTGAGALFLADLVSWVVSYRIMAALMLVGMTTVLVSSEPDHRPLATIMENEQRVRDFLLRSEGRSPLIRNFGAHFIGAVVCPLVDFLTRYGWLSVLVLALIGTYKISDISMAAMANPLYLDLGFSLSEIATVSKIFGVAVTIVGGLTGGLVVARFGIMPMMLIGAILVASTNLLFAWLSTVGYSIPALTVTIAGDNFSNGFASTIFIAYMSALTNRDYSATQYALFSSLMNLPAKFIGGFSGTVVDAYGYFDFFLYVAGIGIPAIVLVIVLMAIGHWPDREARNEGQGGS